MKTILVTGGAGFIGSHMVERLCSEYNIIIYDNFLRDSLKEIPGIYDHKNVTVMQGDVLDAAQLDEAVSQSDIVVHMAAIAGVSSYYKTPDTTLKVNIIGTYNLLEACAKHKVEKVIDFSTSEVYGPDAFDVHEDIGHSVGSVNDLRWTYAVSKLAGENLTHRYGDKHGFKSFTLRPFNIYGPRQTGEGAIANFLRCIMEDKPLQVYDSGSAIRAWCYVDDFVDALVTIISDDDLESGIFNIGNPHESCTTYGLAKFAVEASGKDLPIEFKPSGRTDVRVRVPNIERAQKLLGFSPKIDLRTGLARTLKSYLEKA